MAKNEFNTSFLGTGWSFPPEFAKKAQQVRMSADERDIEESLQILLSTRLGERIMHPDYGCDLTDLIFEPLSVTVKTYISNLVETAILYHEPRILLHKIDLLADSENEGLVKIKVEYTVSSTNSRKNYVYPFYINEGTNLNK
ncbi:GPW/gp25 family protein [Sunxiuqinia indica]|uniref:GPW/gp25 family protein n=1 Tax=Sunxiuqinia indica TaxID=2692584 RepID=UPI001359385D|nr:GPW/gp25 family protein [Sunxiuqinia indica]